jgi:hypothetical protein
MKPICPYCKTQMELSIVGDDENGEEVVGWRCECDDEFLKKEFFGDTALFFRKLYGGK